jgi:hypothetical protein
MVPLRAKPLRAGLKRFPLVAPLRYRMSRAVLAMLGVIALLVSCGLQTEKPGNTGAGTSATCGPQPAVAVLLLVVTGALVIPHAETVAATFAIASASAAAPTARPT